MVSHNYTSPLLNTLSRNALSDGFRFGSGAHEFIHAL